MNSVDTSLRPTGRNSAPGIGEAVVLTAREIEVLRLLCSGLSAGAIATALGLSVRTVERHTENLYCKLDVHNRVQATGWAIRHGLECE